MIQEDGEGRQLAFCPFLLLATTALVATSMVPNEAGHALYGVSGEEEGGWEKVRGTRVELSAPTVHQPKPSGRPGSSPAPLSLMHDAHECTMTPAGPIERPIVRKRAFPRSLPGRRSCGARSRDAG